MTTRLYMDDCYKNVCDAEIESVGEDDRGPYVVLDQTVFYPQGGGQPADRGTLTSDGEEVAVTHVGTEDGEVRHYVEEHDVLEEGENVEVEIDWERRHQLMRAHTAQHIISAVVLDLYGGETAGNQVKVGEARIDFNPVTFSEDDIKTIEAQCNAIVHEKRSVHIYEEERAVVEEKTDHRANLDLIPDHIDPLRVVEIEGIDMCPCGGTHVQNTEEIGTIEITDWEKKGEDTYRVYFELGPADQQL